MFIRRKHLVGAMAVVAVAGLTSAATVSAAAPGAAVVTTTSVVPTAPPTSEPATGGAGEGTITVAATGTVRVDPDTAVVNLGVQANAATGSEAMDQVNSASTALTEALVASGIAEEDIQTSGLNLFTTTDDRGEISGYQASVQVNVTIRDIATVGATIDTAQQAAGPGFTIGGVSFTFSDPESVLGDARRDAVELARTKAEQYAAAAGLTLGAVVSITEQQADVPLIFDGGARVAAEAAAPSISPGQLDLSVFVTVSYSTTS
jgi:uncharacterized protein